MSGCLFTQQVLFRSHLHFQSASFAKMADIVYFLDCQSASSKRSAVAHFGVADLDKFNTGAVPKPPGDEFTWVTPNDFRVWEGFMYGEQFSRIKKKCLLAQRR
jgi:hypothetical protein